jgi:hypothetical protein
VDSDELFGNFLQLPAFRSTPRPRNPFAVLRPVALVGTMRVRLWRALNVVINAK